MTAVIPAIDIIEGRCIRLTQGDYASQKTYDGKPEDWARAYADCGVNRLHLVDLEGAIAASPKNLRTLERIASLDLLELEWGGGIKNDAALADVLNAGARWAIVGSVAVREPEKMKRWLARYGESIILGADAINGRVAVNGWQEDGGMELEGLIGLFLPCGLKQAIVTDISRDGMLQGPSFELYTGLQERFPDLGIIVSGGVSGADDILRASELDLHGIIVGKAIYEKRITFKELTACLRNA